MTSRTSLCLAVALGLAQTTARSNGDSDLTLSGLGSDGFSIVGAALSPRRGKVGGAGDVNGDGVADLLVESRMVDGEAQRYVVFGRNRAGEVLDLDAPDTVGLAIRGQEHFAITGAGDINGDGLSDVALTTPGADFRSSGKAYVVFGQAGGIDSVSLSDLGPRGFAILEDAGSIISMSGAGDVNGDGLDDLLLGVPGHDPGGYSAQSAGRSYVVFGKSDHQTIALSDLGVQGYWIDGISSADVGPGGDRSGNTVSGIGDFNGDGLADLAIGAGYASFNFPQGGEAAIVFGKNDSANVQLSSLGSGGLLIDGSYDALASSHVSGAGDINGDGLADVVFGAPIADQVGKAYVIFGSTAPGISVDIRALGQRGFAIVGAEDGGGFGYAVAGAGDLNGDGFADLAVTASRAIGPDDRAGGAVVFGGIDRVEDLSVSNLGSAGFRFGDDAFRTADGSNVAAAGDVNADGLSDLVIGGALQNDDGERQSRTYVVFGSSSDTQATYRATSVAGPQPLAPVGVVGNGATAATSDSRTWLGFDAGLAASSETVTLDRTVAGVDIPIDTANAAWTIASNRDGWSRAELAFRYLDRDIAGLPESSLRLYQSASKTGPWAPLTTQIDATANRAYATTNALGHFVLADPTSNKTISLALPVADFGCPGFYIATVDAIRGQGRWGLSVDLLGGGARTLQGGINVGGGFGGEESPGFVAFNIANRNNEPQRIDARVEVIPNEGFAGSGFVFELVDRSGMPTVIASEAVRSGLNRITATLTNGFYVARVQGLGASGLAGNFQLEMTTFLLEQGGGGGFQGGVNAGGLMDLSSTPSLRGFAGFCISTQQSVRLTGRARQDYGAAAVGELRLELRNRERALVTGF